MMLFMTYVARCDTHTVLPEGTRRAVQLQRTLETRHLESDHLLSPL